MKKKSSNFSEKDIQATIRYLKSKDPLKATRENAIKTLQGMKIASHVIAHATVLKAHKVKK